jgi:general secretion pathway protein E
MTGANRGDVALPTGVGRAFLLRHRLCPSGLEPDGALRVAVDPDADLTALGDLAVAFNTSVRTHEVSPNELEQLIERTTTRAARAVELTRQEDSSDPLLTDIRDLANQPPVVRYVNLLVRDAFDAGASDVHLEFTRAGLAVRFRVDGVLLPAPEPPRGIEQAVVSRLKLLAEMDISERRRPQDGRIRVRLEDREMDLRAATVPTMFGESLVLRLLERGSRPVTLDELGMPPEMRRKVEVLAARPHGLLLVTGPTGSGKTTTLYACLAGRHAATEKIITVEDPVEYQLPGVTQVPVQRQAGITFASALRSILRQDPDVLMVGEMRDSETADIAVQSAMTGHLVFSTLHTNDAVGAIPRLLDLGVPAFLIAATLEAVLSQRLVRRVCPSCTDTRPVSAEKLALLGTPESDEIVESFGRGCTACRGTGFRGRAGIFELMTVSDDLRDAIAGGHSRNELRNIAEESGMAPLRWDGCRKVREGVTTIDEVLRVAES